MAGLGCAWSAQVSRQDEMVGRGGGRPHLSRLGRLPVCVHLKVAGVSDLGLSGQACRCVELYALS